MLRTTRFWLINACALSLSAIVLGFWALLWIFASVPALGIVLPLVTFVCCLAAMAGWVCTEQSFYGEEREWVKTKFEVAKKPEEIPALSRGPKIGVWKDPEATRMPDDPAPITTWVQDGKGIVGILGLKDSTYTLTIQGTTLSDTTVPFGWGMEFIGRVPDKSQGGKVADNAAAKRILRIVQDKGDVQGFVLSPSGDLLKEVGLSQLCSQPGCKVKVSVSFDGSSFQFWSQGVRRPDLDVRLTCKVDRVEVFGLADFRVEVHKLIQGRLVSRRGHITEGKDLYNAALSREQAERDVMTIPRCMGFTYDLDFMKAYFKQVDYSKRGGYVLSTGNHVSCVFEEERGEEPYTNEPHLPWLTSAEALAPSPVTIGAPQEEVPLLAATEDQNAASQVPRPRSPTAADVFRGPGSRMASAGVKKDLVLIEAGVGWAVHGLVFVWNDGSRTGTVLEHDTTNSALTNRARLGIQHRVEPGRRVVKVTGNISKGGYLAYGLVFHFDVGPPISVSSTHERWKKEAFEFTATPGHHIVDLEFRKGAVVGIKEQPIGPDPSGISVLDTGVISSLV